MNTMSNEKKSQINYIIGKWIDLHDLTIIVICYFLLQYSKIILSFCVMERMENSLFLFLYLCHSEDGNESILLLAYIIMNINSHLNISHFCKQVNSVNSNKLWVPREYKWTCCCSLWLLTPNSITSKQKYVTR